ncbi:LacI family DNA-binding transcriptional regulator [Thermus thalpophilus]|uniref:LacI family DNA-binding transcriptional regulator n=1 Tax=Thermus thalpophilus TaxID=2908147 RepID=UPI001FAA5A90|nr:LacI family DNA-binding transcriptional regulator [Thermus thalpophilus]
MRSKERPTIKEIARLANVSTGTVSRVLNGRPGVSPHTRAVVLEAVKTLGFVPNAAARELVGKSTLVGLLFAPGVRRYTPYFALLLEALSEALWREGLRVGEVSTDPQGLPREEALAYILLGAHDHDPRVEVLQAQGKPFVLIGTYPGVFWVAPDDRQGGYLATRHLLELGHRDVAMLTGHLHHQAGKERLLGYNDALREAGLPFRAELVLDGDFDALTAYRAVRRAWERGVRFTALFAASDEMALGAWAAFEDLGIKVPEGVSLVGYDDLPELGERLTTIHQDVPTVAKEAVALLRAAVQGAPPVGKRVPVYLVPRGTTARKEVGTLSNP